MHIRVTTSGRLHLGFMDLNGGLGRLFGSIGVPVSNPKTDISVTIHPHLWIRNVEEGLKRRISDFIHMFSKYYRVEPNVAVQVHDSIPEHKGLGSGTQLALAVSTALARIHGIRTDAYNLSMLMGRGARSSIGIWSFERGGLIVDSGKKRLKDGRAEAYPPKTLMRYDFPDDWRFVVVIPEEKQGLSGEQEKKAINFLHPSEKISEEICRLVMMKLLPSLLERDIETFGSALTEIDRQTGMFFVPVQGGIYSEKQSYGNLIYLFGIECEVVFFEEPGHAPAMNFHFQASHAQGAKNDFAVHFFSIPVGLCISNAQGGDRVDVRQHVQGGMVRPNGFGNQLDTGGAGAKHSVSTLEGVLDVPGIPDLEGIDIERETFFDRGAGFAGPIEGAG